MAFALDGHIVLESTFPSHTGSLTSPKITEVLEQTMTRIKAYTRILTYSYSFVEVFISVFATTSLMLFKMHLVSDLKYGLEAQFKQQALALSLLQQGEVR